MSGIPLLFFHVVPFGDKDKDNLLTLVLWANAELVGSSFNAGKWHRRSKVPFWAFKECMQDTAVAARYFRREKKTCSLLPDSRERERTTFHFYRPLCPLACAPLQSTSMVLGTATHARPCQFQRPGPQLKRRSLTSTEKARSALHSLSRRHVFTNDSTFA